MTVNVKTSDRSGEQHVGTVRPLLYRAALLTAMYLLVHLAGMRQYTSVLSGTASFGPLHRLFGVIYIVFYGLFVVCVPILLLAAALLALCTSSHTSSHTFRRHNRRCRPTPAAPCLPSDGPAGRYQTGLWGIRKFARLFRPAPAGSSDCGNGSSAVRP